MPRYAQRHNSFTIPSLPVQIAIMFVWIVISLSLGTIVLLDIGLTRQSGRLLGVGDALVQSVFWISLALVFGFFIYFTYQYNVFSGLLPQVNALNGEQALSQYISVYVIERILSIDNLFVILLLFQIMNVPVQQQYRVLFYGMLIAIVIRVLLITFGVTMLDVFPWLHYFVAVLLLWSAIKLIAHFAIPIKQRHSAFATFLNEKLRVKSREDGKFIFKQDGHFFVSPLFISLLCIEYTDLVFSMDSIPAALTLSNNGVIIASASVFAILGMRSLYFIFASVLFQLRYIKFALLFILLILSLRSFLIETYPIDISVLLIVISLSVLIATVFSLIHYKKSAVIELPFAEPIRRIYTITYIGFRRLIVTLLGISVLIIGVIMIVTPGPAIIVIPAGIAILATEFIWARLLLKKVREKITYYGKESKSFFKRKNEKKD